MTIEWLAGNRIRGTSAEKPVASLQSPSVGGWVELGRTTLGSSNADCAVSGLSDKRYYMVLFDQTAGQSGSCDPFFRFNTDTGSNYAGRVSDTGGADAATTSQSDARIGGHPAGTTGNFGVGYVSNLLAKEKLALFHEVGQNTAGAGTAPYRAEGAIKWSNTAAAISNINVTTSTAATWNTGTEVVVLGWDPADTHSTNFWEELATVELGSGNADIDTGTITAKKYLWIQWYIAGLNITSNSWLRFNDDTGSNYSMRYSTDGGADATSTSSGSMRLDNFNDTLPKFGNAFIINNSANEKLVTGSVVGQKTAGAGTASSRFELANKWSNTSAQITDVKITTTSATTFDTGSYLKVWGSD